MNCVICGRPVKTAKTKPSRYCSIKCKSQWRRLEAKVLAYNEVDSLVAAVQAFFAGAAINDRNSQFAALTALATHRLIRLLPPPQDAQARAGLRLSSSSAGGGPAPATPPAPGQDDSISAEIASQQNADLRIVIETAERDDDAEL